MYVFREARDVVVRIVDEHRVIVHSSDLVELVGLITCVETGFGQVVLVWSCACPALLGRVSTARTCGVVVGGGLEVTVKEQQGSVKHEKGEGEMERTKAHMQQTPFS